MARALRSEGLAGELVNGAVGAAQMAGEFAAKIGQQLDRDCRIMLGQFVETGAVEHVTNEIFVRFDGGRTRFLIEQRQFTDDEILKRLLFASVNETCKILEEGKCLRASDMDVMWLHGFGFPRYRGGLMFWADGIGVKEVYRQIEEWHQRYGARWKPAALLKELAESGTSFREAKPKVPMFTV